MLSVQLVSTAEQLGETVFEKKVCFSGWEKDAERERESETERQREKSPPVVWLIGNRHNYC